MTKFYQEKMSISEWEKVPTFHRQRDTEKHARLAAKKHLKYPSRTQVHVSAAKYPDGSLVKLDGHTRGYLWSNGKLALIGDAICVTVYDVVDELEANDLYSEFDNQNAVESGRDKQAGAFRSYSFTPKSNALKRTGLTTPLKYIYGTLAKHNHENFIYRAIESVLPELKIIDSKDIGSKSIPSGLMAVMIATVKVDGGSAMDFWELVLQDRGEKSGKYRDAVEHFNHFLNKSISDKTNTGSAGIQKQMNMAVACYISWLDNKGLKSRIGGRTTFKPKCMGYNIQSYR